MKFIPDDFHLNFIGQRFYAAGLSLAILAVGVVAFIAQGGFNYGIDFRGGSQVQIQFKQSYRISNIRAALTEANIEGFALQTFGDTSQNEYLISLPLADDVAISEDQSPAARVESVLSAQFPDVAIRRVESVGPRVGEELKTKAVQAILFSLGAIMLYTWFRFQWRFSIGAVVALMHDILVVLIAFLLTQKEITLPVVAAVLTVAGYSINDSIVIFDRIRENMRKFQKMSTSEIFNTSLSQTMSRTLLTSGTTLFVVLSLFIFGGEIINDFSFALLLGVIAGTYSSIFIAAPIGYELLQRFPAKTR